MAHASKDTLTTLTQELTAEFARWDNIYKNGGSDPFWEDGMGLNLIRNHIIYTKREIEKYINEEKENTLFSSVYPDIYYRETPNEVSYKYMAKETEIRNRAKEQFALYEQNPDFQYIRDHYKEAFPHGETKATREAKINPWKFLSIEKYEKSLEDDNLVEMRRNFRPSYEEQAAAWAENAKELRAYLERDRSGDDNSPIDYDYGDDEEFLAEELETSQEPSELSKTTKEEKVSLDTQINNAKIQAKEQQSKQLEREVQAEQLSFF